MISGTASGVMCSADCFFLVHHITLAERFPGGAHEKLRVGRTAVDKYFPRGASANKGKKARKGVTGTSV
jgi:hypothetical protein